MVSTWINSVPGSFGLVARSGRWWRLSWRFAPPRHAGRTTRPASADEQARRRDEFRYHLGRGRRAREAGRFEAGALEARRALSAYASDPWALALLGQCLYRQREPNLDGARLALQRAWTLDPTNGYFVGLLLDVLREQRDEKTAQDVLEWAWWRGAPVERWLPAGPPVPARRSRAAAGETIDMLARSPSGSSLPSRHGTGARAGTVGRQQIPA